LLDKDTLATFVDEPDLSLQPRTDLAKTTTRTGFFHYGMIDHLWRSHYSWWDLF
jgi:hypothetical protein